MIDAKGRRGPKPRSLYDRYVRLALMNCGNTRALARNKLCRLPSLVDAADELPHDLWHPEAHALRRAIKQSVKRVLELADLTDRQRFEPVLVSVMHGDTIEVIAKRLGYCRETLQRTTWAEAASAVTTVFLAKYARSGAGETGAQRGPRR